jgi:hypothetical protein
MLPKRRPLPFPMMKYIIDSIKLKVKKRLNNIVFPVMIRIKKHRSQKATPPNFVVYFVTSGFKLKCFVI